MTTRLNQAEYRRLIRQVRPLPDGCWEWLGPLTPSGHGKHRIGPGHYERAVHRILWEHVNGPVPDKMELDHLCHTRAVQDGTCLGGMDCPHRRCVNPEHLEPVTGGENTLRSRHYQRSKTHCPHGHEYTEENTERRNGRRFCRTCSKLRKR